MNSQANVKSIQALVEFRNALGQFCHETQQSLDTIAHQIRRFEEWLAERQRYWQQQIEYCQEEVYRTQHVLEDCSTRSVSGGKFSGRRTDSDG